MIQVIPVKRAYVSMSCDWAGCPSRIDFPEGPDDEVRSVTLLNAAYAAPAVSAGRSLTTWTGKSSAPTTRGGGMTVLLITHTYRKESP